MALEDIRAPGRHGANIYRIIHRFLHANIGKPWASVYSRLCAVADSRTYCGEEVRRCIGYEVDINGFKTRRWRNDLFVDDSGILRQFEQEKWHTSWERTRQNAPIERIFFVKDGPDLWYELTDIPDGPRASKYTRMHKVWFKAVRTIVKDTRPLDEWEIERAKVGLTKVQQGKKKWYKEISMGAFWPSRVGGKVLHALQEVAAKRNPPGHKILRLDYHLERGKGWSPSDDKYTMYAYVSGQSQ